MKIKIFLFTFNRPDLLGVQIKLINRFIKNEHQICVIHDSRNDEFVSEFLEICENLGVNFFHKNSLPGRSPSEYHSQAIQWSYENIIMTECGEDIVVLLDHDMFLIDDFDVVKYMENYDAAGCLQKREQVEYFWPGLTILKMKTTKDIQFNFLNGYFNGQLLDTGGGTCELLSSGKIKYKDTGVEYPDEYDNIDLKDPSISGGFNFELHLDGKFLHSRNASSWHNNMIVSDHQKTQVILQILNDFIETNG